MMKPWRSYPLVVLVVLLAAMCDRFVNAQTSPVPGGAGGAGGGAPTTASYVVGASNASIPNALVLGGRAVTFGTGIASVLDPLTMFFVYDEFATRQASSTNIGTLGWTITSGTGAVQASVAGRPGIFRRTTTTTINTSATMHVRATATTGTVSPADFFDTLFIIRVNQADANTTMRVGLMNSAAGDPANDGIYFERLDTDTNWFGVSRIGSSTGRIVTGTAMDTNWVRLRIRRSDASTVSYSINGGTEVSTASVTNAILMPAMNIKNTAAADKTFDIDYFDLLVGSLSR